MNKSTLIHITRITGNTRKWSTTKSFNYKFYHTDKKSKCITSKISALHSKRSDWDKKDKKYRKKERTAYHWPPSN